MRCALLHGFAGDPSSWDEVIDAWPRRAGVEPPVAVALPGHGGGEVRAGWDANLDLVSASIASCDVVVGYSLGARVALGLIATGRAPRAVLISVNPGLPEDERAARRASDDAWARLLRERGLVAFEAAWTGQPLFASQAGVDEQRRARRRTHRLALDAEQLARSLEEMGLAAMPDYRDALAPRRDRLAVIAGADDSRFAALARTIPAASLELLEGCGHDPTLEQPRELAAAIVRACARLA